MKRTILTHSVGCIIFLVIGFMIPQYLADHEKTPSITVDVIGQTEYPLADIAEFNILVKNAPKNLQKIASWKVISDGKPINFKSLPDDKIIFPVGMKPARMIVVPNFVYVDPKTKQLVSADLLTKDVNIGGVSPDVPTPPTPPPTPTPVGPTDGKYKIATLVYTSAKTLVKSGDVAKGAKALSDSYTTTAKEIDDNKYATLLDVYKGLKAHNGEAFDKAGENKDNWQDWDVAIRHYIASLQNSKQLPGLSDHAGLFREIANGLSYVK